MAASKGKPKRFKRVGIVVKMHQEDASELALQVGEYLLERGHQLRFSAESAAVAKQLKKTFARGVTIGPKASLVEQTDFIIVLGGDGTYLSIARLMKKKSIPVLGINMGQLGFLTEIKRDETFDVLPKIFDHGDYQVSQRILLDVTLRRKGKVIFRGPVVNDLVISKGAIARIIGMQIAVNGAWISNVRADGLIVSTPTGSTAYSLAAGGPVIEPRVPALVITPVCPHSLTHRPLVVRDDSEVHIRLHHRPGHVLLTLDGQDAVDMKEDDVVEIRKFTKHFLQLVSSPDRDYFGLLREKLKFGTR